MERECASCGNPVKDGASFCNTCGASLVARTVSAGTRVSAQISPEDAQEIIEEVRATYASIPLLARPMVPPLPQILRKIPACARKYTLQQLIDLLEEAHARGLI